MFLARTFIAMLLTFTPVQHSTQPSTHSANPWAAGNQAIQEIVIYATAVEKARVEAEKEAAEIETVDTVSNSDTPTTPDAFLACTRAHESDTAGGYGAVSPGGTYRGAYQFDRSTWDSQAASSGRDDLVGVDPATASSGDQDQLALDLYAARGNAPWGGRC